MAYKGPMPQKRYWIHLNVRPNQNVIRDIQASICAHQGLLTMIGGVKLRLRGRGSGHLEDQGNKEAAVPLMLALTGRTGLLHSWGCFFVALRITLKMIVEVQALVQLPLDHDGGVPGKAAPLAGWSKHHLHCDERGKACLFALLEHPDFSDSIWNTDDKSTKPANQRWPHDLWP